MKIVISIFSLFLAGCLLSCNKEDFNYPEGKVGSSKLVNFPLISTKGTQLIIMNVGGSYTEQGATATIGGATAQYTTTGTVNTSTAGVYNITYTAVNADGFSASDFRTVVVLGTDVSGNDLSGTYLRGATGETSTWTKTANGVYTVENPGGASSGEGLTVIAVNYSGNKIAIPHQNSPDFGEVSSASESYAPTPPPATIKYIFYAGGYGTSLRTFTKQ